MAIPNVKRQKQKAHLWQKGINFTILSALFGSLAALVFSKVILKLNHLFYLYLRKFGVFVKGSIF
jgi:hypothetical protein